MPGNKTKGETIMKKLNKIILTMLLMLVIKTFVFASSFTCFPPVAAGGVINISLRSGAFGPAVGPIPVNIPPNQTAAQKAALIAAAINASPLNVGGRFAATAAGATVTVVDAFRPNQKVFFNIGPDATGEKTSIDSAINAQVPWWHFWEAPPIFEIAGTASGTSFDGSSAGHVYIGTSMYMATVNTTASESPQSILTDAANQLTTAGITGVNVYATTLGYALSFDVNGNGNSVIFGYDDNGLSGSFQMFESQNWLLTGNKGTNSFNNFLGTTDTASLAFRVNNQRSGFLDYAHFNTAFGVQAYPITATGANNTAIGYKSLFSNTMGTFNNANGNNALYHNTTGNANSAFGNGALFGNTTGHSSVAIGAGALLNIQTANNVVAVGDSALKSDINTSIDGNTALGSKALYSNTTGKTILLQVFIPYLQM